MRTARSRYSRSAGRSSRSRRTPAMSPWRRTIAAADRADAPQPGQPVRRVPPQDGEVGVPPAWDLVPAGDLGLVDDGQTRLLRIQHTDARILDEREQVPVARWRSRPSR